MKRWLQKTSIQDVKIFIIISFSTDFSNDLQLLRLHVFLTCTICYNKFMKIDITQIKELLEKQKDFLRNTYQVDDLGVFGSVARGDNNEVSDIDVLVKFVKPVGMFKFIELEEYLSKLLGKRVDLVT